MSISLCHSIVSEDAMCSTFFTHVDFTHLKICVCAAMTLFFADLRWTTNLLNIMIFVGIHF